MKLKYKLRSTLANSLLKNWECSTIHIIHCFIVSNSKDNGKAIIGMKAYGAGELLHKKDECLEFQTGAGFIDSFTLCIESIEQLRDIQKRLPEASVRG